MSRHDDAGVDLPPEALTIDAAVDDIAAVLDDAHVESAVVYGTSYGTYLAAGLGVRHPGRVHAMVLDSPLLSADDIDAVRTATRRVLWDGDDPDTAELAAKVRTPGGGRRAHSRDRATRRGHVRVCRPRRAAPPTRPAPDGPRLVVGRTRLGHQAAAAAQDALSPRTRPGRPDRLPRAQLRRSTRRRAARPGGRLPRDRHRRRGFRGRAVRSRRGHAQLRVAHRGDLRRP